MSVKDNEKADKDCGHEDELKRKRLRNIFVAITGFIILILFAILLVWLILRPTKPHFVLQDARIYSFNLSTTNFLTTNLQVTLASRNPNERIGIYYDKLEIYASYHSHQITVPSSLPSSYQGHKDTTVWSPFMYGSEVPVAAYLKQDEMAGTVLVNFRADGKIRWKVGTFVSGRYNLHVNCPAYIDINNGGKYITNGVAVQPTSIKYQLIMDCHVDV